ncbi:hypothetical protein N7499_004321 [Penicillium canescens]|uniref:Transcription factor domain-containing protein n=1 Tax=Penicillium canescens TaxID=5083 RepID=A0AAD6N7Q9_PENCN|nr:uncharacterized protein N7446_005387 [Penicillium canescens]KAJ6038584.1 hypothetical protein N7460_008355 [Penicillium canescens]KAJ6039357.1 hypothetical protein N7444_008262 [Penicillium canescens]KAJ6068350.1 hypothetical protein N7446_005387 [Penicillium canescens]KAJ6084692.1 hypothetical protein N7499_004321 [Penicillium canescens]KAJ6161478.1 hypothetical protein N7485_009708 [Penicillium canescens]
MTSKDANTPGQPSPRRLSQQAETCSQGHDSEPLESTSLPIRDTEGLPWMDGIFDSYLDQQWDFTPDLAVSASDFPTQNCGLSANTLGQGSAGFNLPNSDRQSPSSASLSAVSDRVLAQHYTQNLTSKYSSKERGWNNHTYFFNRFSSSHPFVISSLYAWTAAHLHCYGALGSEVDALEHYGKSLAGLRDQLGIHLLAENVTEEASQTWFQLLAKDDDLDAVSVTLYFLAWTDLLLSRQASLKQMLSLEALLLGIRGHDQLHSIYVRMAVWFCFLDARTALFCQGNDRIIQSMGDDSGLVIALEQSHDFLQREYTLLYPREERQWDEAHRPLYVATCRLVGLLGKVSRSHGHSPDESLEVGVRESLYDIRLGLDSFSEAKAAENKVLSIYLTTNALFHAVEIYASRVYQPNEILYAKSIHAEKIITITRHFYRKLKRPRTEAPPTKIWPVPLIMAAIEAKDPIYREWTLQQIKEYCRAGKHFVNACTFVENVHAAEEATGCRADFRRIAQDMGDDFVI